VIDDEAGPVADAGVELRSLVDDEVVLGARSDGRGEFALTLRRSASMNLRASAAAHAPVEALVPPGCAPVHVTLPRGLAVVVEVVDTTGRGVPQAEVRLSPSGWRRSLFTGLTDQLGRFVARVSPARWAAEATLGDDAEQAEASLGATADSCG
jgi:hypothetical protein